MVIAVIATLLRRIPEGSGTAATGVAEARKTALEDSLPLERSA
jgi:hypothetical protein